MPEVSKKEPLRLFISYSRQVMIDRRDLPYGEAWRSELAEFIQRCDTSVWLISAASLASRWVNWELGEVQRAGKRLMPVAVEPVAPEALPEILGEIHILPAVGAYESGRHLDLLTAALEADHRWIKEASRLTDRAREWVSRGRAADRLLRGAALRDAETWRARQPDSAPPPTQDVLDLLAASERGAKRRARWSVAALALATAITAGLAATALFNAEEARQNADLASRNEAEAVTRRDQALSNESRLNAALSEQYLQKGDWARALHYAWAAAPKDADLSDRPPVPEALRAMAAARHGERPLAALIPGTDLQTPIAQRPPRIDSVAWSASGRFLTTAGTNADRADTGVWNVQTGRMAMSFERAGAQGGAWSHRGDLLALSGGGEGLRILDMASGETVCQGVAAEPAGAPLRWSPESDRVAAAHNGELAIFDAKTCRRERLLGPAWTERAQAASLAWSPDGGRLAAGGRSGGVWAVETGALLRPLAPEEPIREMETVAFSADGARLVVDFPTYRALLDAADLSRPALARWTDSTGALDLSPDGARLALGGWRGDVRIYATADGSEAGVFWAGEDWFTAVAWSPDGSKLAAASNDGSVTVWSVAERRIIDRFWGKYDLIDSIAWSPDGARLAVAGDGDHVRVWTVGQSPLLQRWRVEDAQNLDDGFEDFQLHWSPDAASIAIIRSGRALVWRKPETPAAGWRQILNLGPDAAAVGRLFWTDGGAKLTVQSGAAQAETIYDARSGERLASQAASPAPPATAPVTLEGAAPRNFDATRDLHAVAPNRALLARILRDGKRGFETVEIWDARLGVGVAELPGHEGGVKTLAISPDGAWLATLSYDRVDEKFVRLWRLWPSVPALVQETEARLKALDPLTLREKCLAGLAEEPRLCGAVAGDDYSGVRY